MQPEVQYEQDNQEQPKKRTRTTNKCGACMGGSRPCGPACAYRKLFPDGRFKVAADMIIKFFKKYPLVELVERCTDDQISKLRDNLFFICSFLYRDPVQTPLDDSVELKRI